MVLFERVKKRESKREQERARESKRERERERETFSDSGPPTMSSKACLKGLMFRLQHLSLKKPEGKRQPIRREDNQNSRELERVTSEDDTQSCQIFLCCIYLLFI